MQSSTFTLSPSLSVSHHKPRTRFHPSRTNVNVASVSSLPLRPWSLASSSSSSSFKLRPWTSLNRFEARATSSVPERDGGAASESGALFRTVELGALFGMWFIFNIYFNIYNKQVLKVYPFPLTITAIQFALGTVIVAIMWGFNLYKRPNISRAQLAAILPLAVVHTLGNLFTNMSLGKVAVSFTHTIKASEPFFSVILSAMFLGEMPTTWVVASLVPIVGGVALASATEASFNCKQKITFCSCQESIDNITLFSIITVMSFLLSAPVTIFMEGVKFTPTYLQAAGLNINEVYIRSLLAALCFHAYQQFLYEWTMQVSYMILQRVSPVSHSVGNCVKRVVVIASSVLFFKTPVSPVNAFGTAIALAGVFLYSRVKRIKAKTA
ncbi:hypothetical protein TanjilG_29084 [Lupinus angustifolius]|uniref:Sugar phosphate transporter domain-containing protein n=1 Tax=Lupinus angustifolius TaxID=3871 RepID=A0A4P1RT47_LUPAN|nr:hypothetical protein TanjilG_29084 [Lupinus angustifolius]